MKRIHICLAAIVLVLFCTAPILAAKTIKIGGLFDITGGTGSVGTPYAEGVRDYIRYLNDEKGGIRGMQIKLLDVDYAYKIPQALAAYKKFKHEKVVAIQGWGTGDTEAMSPLIKKDKIPYFSASYSEHLTDPKVTPYNFMVGTTYADQARVALKFIKDTWSDKSRNPRVAFIYSDTGFGRSPFFTVKFQGHNFPGAEDYAREIGVDVVSKPIISLRALDATPQLLNMKKADPDFAIVQETSVMATILKDAKKLDLRTKFFALNWAMSAKIASLAGAAAEGCYWTNPFCTWGDSGVGVEQAKMISQKYHPGKLQVVNYFQGFAAMKVMAEAISRVEGEITGPKIKEALENMKNFATGGLTVPLSFSPLSHKGSMGLRVYQVQKGHFVPVKEVLLSR
ncbi:MAG: branched-chain amino acid ABC transporter substrate-binding protein [Deltaproteobacteria bacterium]|nr:MAG: branched-chain amino acid ABC transporter substrate-binding protein [Deltaproteobacteria bacterium]